MCTLVSSIQYYTQLAFSTLWFHLTYIAAFLTKMFARVVKERIAELDKTKTPGHSNSRNSKRRASPGTKQPDTYTVKGLLHMCN